MKDDPDRWENVPADIAELLRAGRPARAIPPDAFDRSRQRVARLGAVAATTSFLLSLKAYATTAVVGAGVGLVVSGAAIVFQPSADRAPVAAPSAAPMKPVRVEIPKPKQANLTPLPSAVARSPSRPTAPTHAKPDAQADTLAAELELLRRARASTDPDRGLALLDEHARRFPSGMLGIERELSAIELLERAGRKSEALTRAESLEARARGTTYGERIEHALRRLR